MVLGLSLSLLTVSFICTPAHAVTITLEPDDYAVGTNLTNAFDGVTLSRYTNDGHSITLNPVYSETVPPGGPMAATGTQIFGRFWDLQQALSCWGVSCSSNVDRFSALVIQFDQPVSFVEVSGSQHHEGINAYALDAYGNLLSIWSRDAYVGGSEPASWMPAPSYSLNCGCSMDPRGTLHVWKIGSSDQTPIIQTVLVGGFFSSTYVDNIRYHSVPEPSSLLLFGVGLAGAAAWRRRQRL